MSRLEKRKATKENIDDLIEEWHESESNLNLHEYLGLTLSEFVRWVETDKLPS